MKLKVLLTILVVVIIASAAWLMYQNPDILSKFGMSSSVTRSSSTTASTSTAPLPGFARGTIENLTDNGFIITLSSNGLTRNVITSATTTVYNYPTASSSPSIINMDALSVGESVLVLGDAPTVTSNLTANVIVTGVLPVKGAVRTTLIDSGITLPASIASATPPLDR